MRDGLVGLVTLAVVISASAWGFAEAPGGGEPFVLVKYTTNWGGDPQAIVVLRPRAGCLEKFAAREFIDYVYRASQNSTILPQAYGRVPEDWNASAMIVGVAGQPPFEDTNPASLPTHGFRIRTSHKRLEVIGASEQGASNALYWLLREKLGVRWYLPTRLGEEVPVYKNIVFDPMDVVAGPDIPVTTGDVRYYGTSTNRLTRQPGYRRDTNTRHIWDQIVRPTDENKRNHPEWFALTDRKKLPDKDWMRKFLWKDADGNIRSNQVCTTNPDVLRMFVNAALTFFRRNPDAKMFPVSPNDYHEFCTCARCRALDKQLGNGPLMNRLIYFFNQIAAEVKKEFPDRYLGFHAYSSHVDPPTTVKPDPMLFPTLCFFGGRACYTHAIDDPNCPINRAWKRDVFDPWVKLCPKFGYYSYYGYSRKWQGPQLMVHTLARDLKLMAKHGVYSFHVDGYKNWATCAPMYYLYRRLPWDVDADYRAILDEWYRGTYGPAYEPMKKYWETMIKGYYQGPHQGSGPDRPHLKFTRDIIEQAWRHMRDAEKIVADRPPLDKYRRRVAIARAGLEYTDAMALGYALAAERKWDQAVEAGKRALKAITDSRALEPAPYVSPLYSRDEQTWVWHTTWDFSNSSEKMTEQVINKWEQERNAPRAEGKLILELPEQWYFRKDPNGIGEKLEWFNAKIPSEQWRKISTHLPWTSQEFPGRWHGTGWYRIDVELKKPPSGRLDLCFGAIDGWAKVWVNGVLVGKHDQPPEVMWNKPWTVDITEAIRNNAVNRIAVSVTKDKYAAGIYKPVQLRKVK